MMKQQHSDTSLRPSKLCRLLLIILALKLTVLGMLLFEPVLSIGLPGGGLFAPSGEGAAVAATGPGASPPIQATLPDAGMRTPSSAAPSESLAPAGVPGAAPGITSPGAAVPGMGAPDFSASDGAQQESRSLPVIRSKGDLGAATEGGIGPSDADVRDVFSRRQEDLSRKEQELRVLESELNARLERMQILESRIATMIKDAEETKDAKFRHLVDVLSNMKAKQAAAVLETLDPKIAVRVLAGMRGRQAGDILTFVKAEIAAKLTEDLARMQMPLD